MDKCPISGSKSECPINPATNLPYAEQLQSQSGEKLDTSRTKSTIPRADTNETWMYPSHQMFYNALKRKGQETAPEHIESMVDIHNFLNEQVWKEIVEWEREFHPDCEPKLKRFMGKPTELSPKARFYTFFGVPKPFDRHDWIIDRCGQDVRYIIDYYPSHRVEGEATFNVDIRPALDSPISLLDRFRRSVFSVLNKNKT